MKLLARQLQTPAKVSCVHIISNDISITLFPGEMSGLAGVGHCVQNLSLQNDHWSLVPSMWCHADSSGLPRKAV